MIRKSGLWFFALLAAASLASAGESPAPAPIVAQPVADALTVFSRQSGLQVIYGAEMVRGRVAHDVPAGLSAEQALARMLEGTGLSYEFLNARTVTIVAAGEGRPAAKEQGRGEGIKVAQGSVAQAADAGARGGAGADEPKLEEVLVTAQKRKERLKDVPVSITALTGDAMGHAGINNTKDMEISVPGMTFAIGASNATLSLRGISTNVQGVAADPSAALYIDGVYQPRFESSLLQLMDIKQVEVLKGPQVVLYGRNATAGALTFASRDPGRVFGGNASAEAGNYGSLSMNAAVDIPIVSDKLLLRAAGMSIKRDSFVTNVFNPADHPGRTDTWGGRLTLKFLPTDNLDITLRGTRVVEDGGRNPFKAVDPVGGFGSAYDLGQDPYKISANQITSMPTKWNMLNVTLGWNLGWAKLTSIAAYDKYQFGPANFDVDSTELTIVHVGVAGQPGLGQFLNSKSYSEETYLTGQTGRFDWLAGAVYFHEKADYGGTDEFGNNAIVYFPSEADTKASAAYSQLGYAVTDRLKLSAGLRYSHESKEAGRYPGPGFSPIPNPTLQFDQKSWNATTPTFTARYRVNDGNMLYATFSKGFKSGAFNVTDVNPAIDPEKITSYELGSKSTWLNGRVGLDVSAYRYYYTDLQVATFRLGSLVYDNAAEARGTGAEASLHWAPIERLQLDAMLSLLDAKFTQYDTSAGAYAGNRLPLAPRYTAGLQGLYRLRWADKGETSFQLNYYYTGIQYFTPDNNTALAQPAHPLINGRVYFVPAGSNLEIGVFGKNITNEKTITNAYNLGTPVVAPGDLRTWGLELKYNF